MPDRRKNSRGASRPSIVNTTLFGNSRLFAGIGLDDRLFRLDPRDLRAERDAHRSRSVVAGGLHELAGRRRDPLGAGVLDRHVRPRVLLQRADLLDVLGLGPREVLPAVGERDVRPGRAESDRGLERRVAAADDQALFPGELLGVVEAVEDLVEVLAGTREAPVIAAAADRDDDAPRLRYRRTVAVVEEKDAPLRSILSMRANVTATPAALRCDSRVSSSSSLGWTSV
jgi:hypothetical protein